MNNKNNECPRCDGLIPNNEMPGAFPGAISRKDNKTEICSECGTAEAILDWIFSTEGVK
jgi:ribosomal protein S27AE